MTAASYRRAPDPGVPRAVPRRMARASQWGGTWRVYRWELVKLALQLRTRVAAVLCLVGPFVFTIVVRTQSALPTDTLFGRWVHVSGAAIPLVVLGFAGLWALPALTSIVTGDLFAAEDRFGTCKTLLTRSPSREQIFCGKVLAGLTYTVVVVLLLGAASIAAGVLLGGDQPLVGLNGQQVPAGRALLLVSLCWAVVLLPTVGFGALAVLTSVATRSSPAGIGVPVFVGLLMQLATLADGHEVARLLMLTTPFTAWHGLLTADPFYGPLVWGAATSLGYLTVPAGPSPSMIA